MSVLSVSEARRIAVIAVLIILCCMIAYYVLGPIWRPLAYIPYFGLLVWVHWVIYKAAKREEGKVQSDAQQTDEEGS